MMNIDYGAALLNCIAKMAYEVRYLSLQKENDSWQKIQTLSDTIGLIADDIRLNRELDEKTIFALMSEVAPCTRHNYESIFSESITVKRQNAYAS